MSREFFELTKIYCHRLDWADDFREVDDRILKFAVTVPDEKTYYYYDMFRERLEGRLEPTTSGHGAIDLILPGCHKASGLKRLAKRRGISPEQCADWQSAAEYRRNSALRSVTAAMISRC